MKDRLDSFHIDKSEALCHMVARICVFIDSDGIVPSGKNFYDSNKRITWKRKNFRMMNGQTKYPSGVQKKTPIGAPKDFM